MKITINSDIRYTETVYDKAYELAKRLIKSNDQAGMVHLCNVVITANKSRESLVVNIRERD